MVKLNHGAQLKMIHSFSTGRKVLATAVAAIVLAFLFDVTVFDSRTAVRLAELRASGSKPEAGSQLRFTATFYCKGTTTASGAGVKNGMAAADPDLLPIGSVIRINSLGEKYDGIYTVMDTGPKVQGRHVDVYLWSCNEALQMGRRKMQLTVLRLGWNPQNSVPHKVDRLFKARERDLTQAAPASERR